MELFLQSFASIVKQSILTLEFSDLLGLLRNFFSLELDLDPKVCHVVDWCWSDNIRKRYMILQVWNQAIIHTERCESVHFVTTLADWVSLSGHFLC